MKDSSVGNHNVIDSCILDEGVSIGSFCYIGFGRTLFPDDSAVTVIGKDVAVPSHTAVGRKCRILPKIKQEDFAADLIPPGTILRPDSSRQK